MESIHAVLALLLVGYAASWVLAHRRAGAQRRARHEEAERLLREELRAEERRHGERALEGIELRRVLAEALRRAGRERAAREELAAACEVARAVYGADHPHPEVIGRRATTW